MTAPEVWWSPSLAEDLSQGGLIERTGPDLWHQEHGTWQRLDELPADAVRLVPDEMAYEPYEDVPTGKGIRNDPEHGEILVDLPAPAPGQAPDVAALLRRLDEIERRNPEVPPPLDVDEVRSLLGTATTPDRLAWISEAGETAAAERQARYQETACALRPDAVTGFVERLAMEWEQRAADVKPAIHATEQDVYGECAARLRGLLAQRDLAAGSWQPFTPTAVTVPTARLTEWAGLLRQLSVHVPLEGPALTRTLEAAQLMQWWAGQEVVRDTATETNRTTSEETPNA